MPETAEKVVPASSKVLGFQYGNILHTGGVGGSKPSASTNLRNTFCPVKNVPVGSIDPTRSA